MNYIQLKEICDLDNGYAFKSDSYVEESNTLNCRMSNIRPDGSFDIFYNAKYLPNEFADKYKSYLLNDGDLIIAMTDMAGDPKILGVPTVVDTKGKKLLLNQRVGKLRFIDSEYEINTDYLKISLQAPYIRTYFKQYSGGGVQLNVGKKEILNAKIIYRNINEQKRIASIFNNINRLINTQKEKICQLDELVKARFVEMFGDPIDNTKNLKTNELKDILILKAGDFTAASDISDEPTETNKYPCYGGNGIRGYVAKYNQEGNYSLVGRQGALSGNVQYAKGKFKNTEHALLVTPKTNMNSMWLYHLLIHLDLTRYQTGAAQPGLSVKNLQEIPIIDVSIESQNEFAKFVEQIDKSKFIIQKQIDETQELSDKLMQDYFG